MQIQSLLHGDRSQNACEEQAEAQAANRLSRFKQDSRFSENLKGKKSLACRLRIKKGLCLLTLVSFHA